ncbi:MAG: hypothetical protein QHI38_09915 [Armatimonadota bacterium]|nr:hypothetical protein [Armatimonadota bacterium]
MSNLGFGIRIAAVTALALLPLNTLAAAKWAVLGARWRPDANPFIAQQVWEDYIWTEGWGYEEQFYPKYMRPAGSLHIVLRNDSGKTDSIALVSFDGKPLEKVSTSEKSLGEIVWYLIESPQLPVDPRRPDDGDLNLQKDVPPGEWVSCTLRLRNPLTKPCTVGFRNGSGENVLVTVEPRVQTQRIESISFSPGIDTIYVYVRSLKGRAPRHARLRLDGKDVSSKITQGPLKSRLVLVSAKLSPAWKYGSFHLVELEAGSEKLVESVRAWDGYFCIGLFGTADKEHVTAAKEKGINTYFWNVSDILDQAEMCTIPHGASAEWKPRTAGSKKGVLFLYNKDEPDAHDAASGEKIPFPHRLGLNAQSEVIPAQRMQRRLLPTVPNLLLVDNTYKPLNYYVYGQIPDIFSTDPYVPLNGRQVDYVYHALECARDASTPRPVVSVLWACSLGGKRKFGSNAPTPEEMRMMIYYAVGCGVKGIGYFIDMTKETGEGQFVGLSDIKPLWEAVGQANREVAVLAPFLAIGCPAGAYSVQNNVWTRTIMCGPDAAVIVLVNTRHYIAFETQRETSFHFPLKGVRATVELPPGFNSAIVEEVVDGMLKPIPHALGNNRLTLNLDSIDAARVFLVRKK